MNLIYVLPINLLICQRNRLDIVELIISGSYSEGKLDHMTAHALNAW